jgi:molecular chaperone GrpE
MAKKTKKSIELQMEEEFLSKNNINEKKNIESSESPTDWKDQYLRLLADFENYKKRNSKEKEDLVQQTKINTIVSILDLDSDLNIARKNIPESEGLNLMIQKVNNFLKNQGIEEIQTESYDPDLHEVVSIVETGENKILDVISKGYRIGEKPFRYPKIILSK